MPKQVKFFFKRREFIVLLGPPSLSQDNVDVMIPIGPRCWRQSAGVLRIFRSLTVPGLVTLCQQRTLGLEQCPQGIGRFNIFLRARGLQAVQDTGPHSVWVSPKTFPNEVCCRIDRPEGKRVTFSRQSNADFGLDREVGHENTNVA